MDGSKQLSVDDASATGLTLRRLARSPTGQRLSLNLRRSSITTTSSSSSTKTSSASTSSSLDLEQMPLPCASRTASSGVDCALYKFIVWAAVKRNACEKMTPEQKRECPLLKCRTRFPNYELMLQHLSTCEYLSDGEYWCYDCGRAEKLNDAKCQRCLGHPSKRRKLMTMAKKVFGSLGNKTKGNPFAAVSSSPNASDEPLDYSSSLRTSAYTELPTDEIHEIDSVEIQISAPSPCQPEAAPGTLPPQPLYPLDHEPGTGTDPQPRDPEADFMSWEPSPSPSIVTMPPPPPPPPRPRPLQDNGHLSMIRPSDRPALQLRTQDLDQRPKRGKRARPLPPQVKRRGETLAPSSSVRSTSSTQSSDSTASNGSYIISPLSTWYSSSNDYADFDSALTSPCDDDVKRYDDESSSDSIQPFALSVQDDETPEDTLPVANPMCSLGRTEYYASSRRDIVANSYLPQLPAEIPSVDVLISDLALGETVSLEESVPSYHGPVPVQFPLNPIELNTSASVDHANLPLPFVPTPSASSMRARMFNARSLVKTAQATLLVHIVESVAKLGELSNNPIANEFKGMSSMSIAHASFVTLAAILDGRQDISPVYLICFVHLIFSLSLVVHEHDIESRCAGLFKQALLYSNWLLPHERPWYIETVYSLWKPDDVSDADIVDLLKNAPPVSVSHQARNKGKASERTLQQMRADSLVMIAQYFLDELEYLALNDFSEPEVQASDLIMHHINDGLGMEKDSPFTIAAKFLIQGGFSGFSTRYPRVPAFVSSLKSIIHQLNSGHISTVRRLELEMMQAGKNHLPPETFFDSFTGQVRRQVDHLYAVHGSTLSSRLTYHSHGIKFMSNFMQEISRGQTRWRNFAVQTGPTTASADASTGAMARDLDFDLEAMINFWDEDYPLIATMPAVDVGELQSGCPYNSQALFVKDSGIFGQQEPAPPPQPTVLSSTSSSSTATPHPVTIEHDAPISNKTKPPAPTTAAAAAPTKASTTTPTTTTTKVESDTFCELCGYRPKGDPRWFGGSMNKHKKLQHGEEIIIYRCPYPGCKSKFSKRPDNLRHHQIEKGHFVDGQEVTGRRSRKRGWVEAD